VPNVAEWTEEMVGPCGLEPQTSSVSRMRSNQLSYGPNEGDSLAWSAIARIIVILIGAFSLVMVMTKQQKIPGVPTKETFRLQTRIKSKKL
jgi:hypothetical protein